MGIEISGVKVFSATMAKQRELLGETVTDWLRANPDKELVDKIVTQSSDAEYHCLTITLFYKHVRRPMCEVDWCEERQGHDGPHTGERKCEATWGAYRCSLVPDHKGEHQTEGGFTKWPQTKRLKFGDGR